MEYVRAIKLSEMTGLTVAAINAKRYSGEWLKDIHWKQVLGKRSIWYCVPAIEAWIKGDQHASTR